MRCGAAKMSGLQRHGAIKFGSIEPVNGTEAGIDCSFNPLFYKGKCEVLIWAGAVISGVAMKGLLPHFLSCIAQNEISARIIIRLDRIHISEQVSVM